MWIWKTILISFGLALDLVWAILWRCAKSVIMLELYEIWWGRNCSLISHSSNGLVNPTPLNGTTNSDRWKGGGEEGKEMSRTKEQKNRWEISKKSLKIRHTKCWCYKLLTLCSVCGKIYVLFSISPPPPLSSSTAYEVFNRSLQWHAPTDLHGTLHI